MPLHCRLFSCALLLVLSLTPALARAETFAGTWSIEPSSRANQVQLGMQYRRGDEEWSESHAVDLAQLQGLTAADLTSPGEQKSFAIVRDAGTFHADGRLSGGHGAGTWTFAPSSSFVDELHRRGVGTPSDKEQFELAMSDFKVSTLDVLLRNGYARPSVGQLIEMGMHGVTDDYIRAMGGVRIEPKTVTELIVMRDHGVTPDYAATMLHSSPQLSGNDLVRLRDHGVSSEYMAALTAARYGNVQPREAESMMDHGVTPEYIAGLAKLGYHPSLDDLVRLADHGVSVEFIKRLRDHGYTHLSVEDLIRLRDHGF